MNTFELADNIVKLEIDQLEIFIFERKEEEGLMCLFLLLDRFNKKKEYKLAELISKVIIIKFAFLDGIEIFQIYFYQNVIRVFPDSILFIECIVQCGLPPFNNNLKEYFDFEMYKEKLFRLSPTSAVLTKIKEFEE